MNQDQRSKILREIASYILDLRLGHPVRVGIDGPTASGKSTFARDLVAQLQLSGRAIIATTLDGFHNPRSKRYERGKHSAEGYYFDAYNYPAVIARLLAPLGPSGNYSYTTSVFDLKADLPKEADARVAQPDTILVVDGSFALRKELREHWDVSIYLDVDFSVAEDRAAIRDAEAFGSAEEARSVTKNRYHGAHKLHARDANPKEFATFVVVNDNPFQPSISSRRD